MLLSLRLQSLNTSYLKVSASYFFFPNGMECTCYNVRSGVRAKSGDYSLSPWFNLMSYPCLTAGNRSFRFRKQFRPPVTCKRLSKSFLFTHIYPRVALQVVFYCLSNTTNREQQAQQCLSYFIYFYCIKIHREKHPLREDCFTQLPQWFGKG